MIVQVTVNKRESYYNLTYNIANLEYLLVVQGFLGFTNARTTVGLQALQSKDRSQRGIQHDESLEL